MPNQMIALQARSPQLPDPAQRTARLANMMNMVRQQEAAQRQTMQAQQAMDIEAAKEARAAALHGPALTKAQQDNIVQALEIFREGVADIAEGDITAAEAVRADLVARVPGWDKVLPPASSWDRNTRYGLMMKADKEIDKTISTPVASLEVSVDGTPTSVTVGGLRPGQQPVYDVVEPTPMPASRATPTTPTTAPAAEPANPFAPRATPTVPPAAAGTDVDMRATRGANTTPQDLIEQGMNPNNIPSDNPTSRPVSFNQSDMGGAGAVQMTPDVMSRIVDSAFQTGVMAQVDFDQLLASQPQQNKQALVDSFRRAKITLQADAPSLAASAMDTNPVQTPQARFADFRGPAPQISNADLGSQPMMRNTEAQTQPRTITKLQQRNPNVSPLPGSAQVPLGRLGAEKTTEAQAAANVNLRMAPTIAAETKKAERAIERKPEALVAKNETKTLIQSIDKYIEEIDALLRSADRRFIVGRIEGNLHYLGSLGQNERQAELQAMFDRVKNADTLGSLVAMKQATPSGGSPVGNASNQDVQLVAKGANSLTQTGGVPKFDADLKKLRRDAYRTRQNAIEFYNDRYGDLSAEDPKFKLNVRPIADRYISSKDLPKKPVRTPTKSTLSPATRAKYGL